MSDLIERLRDLREAPFMRTRTQQKRLQVEAADEIERLNARVEQLETAIQEVSDVD